MSAFFTCLFVVINIIIIICDSFDFPYNTEIKEWKFLHEEPSVILSDYALHEPTDTYDIIYDLMDRVLGGNALLPQFKLELIVAHSESNIKPKSIANSNRISHPFWDKPSSLYLDVMQLDSDGTSVILRGSSTIALAVAFNWYLESYCNTTYDWRTYTVDMPSSLPLPAFVQKVRTVPYSYYENVCTVSYSFAFWDWTRWQRHIDWMAMQGINMPLAFNGQEYIFAKTFAQFGLNTSDLSPFFAGPAFYAWQRMGNMRGWGGPLRESEIVSQYQLQLQIVSRMNTLGMTPALTCFAGHVPNALSKLYPNSDFIKSPDWAGMPSEYCCVSLLNFSDPLFFEIGRAFIETQTKYFGTAHVYQCDTFNEMDPPSASAAYLKSATSYIYEPMNAVDPNAIWLMQGWLFIHSFWTPQTVSAYLSGVANDACIILDLYSEQEPVYQKFDSYYGKSWVWNTLHDFGGHNGMQGKLSAITDGFVAALNYENTTVMGIGTTMEGIWQNYIVYDATYQQAFDKTSINLTAFAHKYAYRRYGLPHTGKDAVNAMVSAWEALSQTVYEIGDPPENSWTTEFPNFNYAALNHDYVAFEKDVWKPFVGVGSALADVAKFRYDLVDVTRQAMSDLFNVYYQNLSDVFNAKSKDIALAQSLGNAMIAIMNDMDRVLVTDMHWMLADWIGMARNRSNDSDTQNWYEFNARNQITLWGPTGQINNYACKQWGDVIGTYYMPQWQLFVDQCIECIKNGSKWNENAFYESNYPKYELPWSSAIGGYHTSVVNDTIVVACELYKKWNVLGDTACTF